MGWIKTWTANLFWGVAGNALYQWLAGGAALAVTAAILAWLRAISPVWRDRATIALITLAIITVGSALQSLIKRKIDIRSINQPPLKADRLEPPPAFVEIVNQSFQSQDILLDGHIYISCTFSDVTFVYNNGETGGFDPTCRVRGNFGFKSSDPHIKQMLFFLEHLHFMQPNVEGRYTPMLGNVSALHPTIARPQAIVAAQRTYARVTPDELMNLCQGRMTVEANRLLEPYIGKWLKFGGSVRNVMIELSPFVPELHRICVTLDIKTSGPRTVLLYFDLEWKDRVSVLHSQEMVEVVGQINGVSAFDITFQHCQLREGE